MRVRRLGLARVVVVASCAAVGALWLAATPAGAVSLPDGRVYELVSPATTEGHANVYVPSEGTVRLTRYGEHGVPTLQSMAAAPDGETVVYAGDPPPTGGAGSSGYDNGEEYLATRSPGGGWQAVDLEPGALQIGYEAFSNDLSTGILSSGPQSPLAPDAPANCSVLYMRTNNDGAYHPAFTTTQTPGECGKPRFDGISADNSHLLFTSTAALIPSAVAGQNNLYESIAGQSYLVNVLPNGKIAANASFGFGLTHVISADGSRIFWTDLDTGVTAENPTGVTRLFVRENGASPGAVTVQVDASVGGGGSFLAASADGSKVFFTKGGHLYQYDIESGQTTDLAEGGGVQGVMGVSDDGSYVYFVAGAVLANNENSEKEKATPEGCEASGEEGGGGAPCNLYVRHEGVTTFITTLSAKDGGSVSPFNFQEGAGDWQAAISHRTAEVTPDGHSLLFMSDRSLTGYDNEISFSESGSTTIQTRALDEVFLYEAGTNVLRCVSCNPSGEAPAATEFNTYKEGYPLGAFIPTNTGNRSAGNTHQARAISEDGSRVFFDSAEPLVPQDTNGWLDVYEWERNGLGSCRESRGCVYLLSGGTSPESSYLLDASANGNDVFIITRAQLLAQDRNDNDDLYDARVGGVPAPPTPACSGSGCQGVPPAPPIFATPSSVTFEGVGNFPPPSKPSVKQKKKPKKPKRCKRGSVNKHDKCAKKAKKSAKGRKQHA